MLLSKLKLMWKKDTVNPYSRSEYIWSDRDLAKCSIVATGIGFVIGVVVGFEWAWKPVINCFRPLIG